jgi:23S rRNA pseudouridine1911/1915/1917 synthase
VKTGNRVWIAAGVIETKSATPKVKESASASAESLRPAKPKAPKTATPLDRTDITIVYSDDTVVVVNKPAGVTTSRSKEDLEEFGPRARQFLPKTLADYLPALLGSPNRPVFPVHRLDRDTSGLIVFARTRDASAHLTKQFRKHSVDRVYTALTRGIPQDGRIESVLVRDRGDGRRGSSSSAVAGEEGQRAVTTVRVVETFPRGARVECRLETGRTHQVRIHLGEALAPLCGERLYDRPLGKPPLAEPTHAQRPMLHALRLGFQHPETEDIMTWEIDPPADFLAVAQELRTLPAPAEGGEA